ncbi:DUF1488 family protein [Variovorax sp. OV329]|uniref:DUF1488 family protein n=1 Tax=Variovorax sp. OV329 TaxID=1882825 RepID=UPI0008F0EE1F|nr:DUF1488 family protein [Variovorax sp. OV329]SFN47979.1 Protein of unknown function [Variovorax sp. OV329]
MTSVPIFHEASGTVRFWVLVEGNEVGAMIGKETLHYLYRPTAVDDVPLETFALHAEELAEAVRRRVTGGAFVPVMLRERDMAT